MNLLEHVCDHLEFQGIGICNTDETAGNLFWGILPDAPDAAAAVMSTDSAFAGSAEGARIQIFTRGEPADVRTPYEMACAVGEALEGFAGYLHGDGPRVSIEALNVAQGCGMDGSGRHLYVSNFRVRYCGLS